MADETGGRRALGRGLAALIGDVSTEAEAVDRARGGRRVPIEFLTPNPRNPRKAFDGDDLEALSGSIKEKGIVQPILVRPAGADRFEIIAGERRWRAAQRAGLHDVPVLVHEASDKEALELAIVENVQRADLNALEEGAGYQELIDAFGYSQAEIATVIGKSRSHVANTLRLLKLPEPVKNYIREGRLSAGHARSLVGADDPEAAAHRIVESGMTVRDAEAMAAKPKAKRKTKASPGKDPDTVALEKALSDATGLRVTVDHRPASGSGEIRIKYLDLDQLDDICRRLQAG